MRTAWRALHEISGGVSSIARENVADGQQFDFELAPPRSRRTASSRASIWLNKTISDTSHEIRSPTFGLGGVPDRPPPANRLVQRMTAPIEPSQLLTTNDRFREGFRMPAPRERSTGYRAGVRKPPKKEPAGKR